MFISQSRQAGCSQTLSCITSVRKGREGFLGLLNAFPEEWAVGMVSGPVQLVLRV